MRVKSFSLTEPLPELKDAQAIAVVKPWIDVNNVGTMVLEELTNCFGAKRLGGLTKPGDFYDFTRYRPTLYFEKGIRKMRIPNTEIYYAKQKEGNDFLFFKLAEPHLQGEEYVESILELLRKFEVKRYCLFGSMYAPVPHTRPLTVTGGATSKEEKELLEKMKVQVSDYEGPTTIVFLVNQLSSLKLGIETMFFVVSLPQYLQLKRDFAGKVRLMEILNFLYNVPVTDEDRKKAKQQLAEIEKMVEEKAGLRDVVNKLENFYDEQEKKREIPLPPEIERMLGEIEKKGFSQN
ncbi:MAG: PAC2 family protein [Candidatus Aerophobetes bacterium]|nr:PAC2 family protein [Candidatus Aerophobetes bacterium]